MSFARMGGWGVFCPVAGRVSHCSQFLTVLGLLVGIFCEGLMMLAGLYNINAVVVFFCGIGAQPINLAASALLLKSAVRGVSRFCRLKLRKAQLVPRRRPAGQADYSSRGRERPACTLFLAMQILSKFGTVPSLNTSVPKLICESCVNHCWIIN